MVGCVAAAASHIRSGVCLRLTCPWRSFGLLGVRRPRCGKWGPFPTRQGEYTKFCQILYNASHYKPFGYKIQILYNRPVPALVSAERTGRVVEQSRRGQAPDLPPWPYPFGARHGWCVLAVRICPPAHPDPGKKSVTPPLPSETSHPFSLNWAGLGAPAE